MRQDPDLLPPLASARWGRAFAEPPTPIPVYSGNWHLGNQYTCPTGKKAIIGDAAFYNPQASAITVNGYIGTAAAANQFLVNYSLASVTHFQWYQGFLLNAGDTLNYTATAQCNGFARVWEFPASAPLVGVKTASINGTVTAYTCPANKTASMLTAVWDCFGGIACNTTAGAITLNSVFTPSGLSAGRMSQQLSWGAASESYVPFYYHALSMNPGDAFGWQATATGMNIWTVWVELEL